jgi:hypothetical protein
VHSDQIALLQKMVKELEEKSVYTDNSISDVKSTTESNTLNISLNHKQMEQINNDRKFSLILFIVNEKITALQALVDELMKRKPEQVIQQIAGTAGPALDMNMLDGRYAGKNPPDNTIVRIEALEKLTKAL